MNISNLLPCKCGAKALLDWGVATEFHGGIWQWCSIECGGKCGRDVSICINSNNEIEVETAEKFVVEMWNKLQRAIKGGE